MVLQEGWIREKEQILSSEDHGKDLTGAVRLLSQHKAFEDEMSGRAAHLQQTIKQGEELVANNHFGAEKIKERIQDIQVGRSGPELSRTHGTGAAARDAFRDIIVGFDQRKMSETSAPPPGTVGGSGAPLCRQESSSGGGVQPAPVPGENSDFKLSTSPKLHKSLKKLRWLAFLRVTSIFSSGTDKNPVLLQY